jgi:hypothetical protein
MSNQSVKSKGLNFNIEYPLSWTMREGKQPNIVMYAKDFSGRISSSITIKLIWDALNIGKTEYEDFPRNEVVDFLLDQDRLLQGHPIQNVSNVNYLKTSIAGCQGSILEFEGEFHSLDNNFDIYYRFYSLIHEQYIIISSFQVHKQNGNLSDEKQAYRDFFNAIMNTLIINEKYT